MLLLLLLLLPPPPPPSDVVEVMTRWRVMGQLSNQRAVSRKKYYKKMVLVLEIAFDP
jgi:hypothetical protein